MSLWIGGIRIPSPEFVEGDVEDSNPPKGTTDKGNEASRR
jgi:hypothetical protein